MVSFRRKLLPTGGPSSAIAASGGKVAVGMIVDVGGIVAAGRASESLSGVGETAVGSPAAAFFDCGDAVGTAVNLPGIKLMKPRHTSSKKKGAKTYNSCCQLCVLAVFSVSVVSVLIISLSNPA